MADEPCCRISKKVQICLAFGLLVAVAVVGVLMWLHLYKWNGQGTTEHFADIILGRCSNYTRIVQPALRNVDCQKIQEAFKDAFISKNPCNITEEDYRPLMKLTTQTIPCSKTILWSKTKEMAHQYTRVHRDMFTLEDTLLGYMADGLMWCGDSGTSEMNYRSCPHWKKDCPNNPVSVFWKMASHRFADAACGVVYVILNGSLSNTFDENSTFGSVEIINLHPEKVQALHAWVIHDVGGVPSDSCMTSSINKLKSITSQRKIAFRCQHNTGLPHSLRM
ncbi:PREDICTED: ADP-ribosyl cyclase/cyclic ADP-ribose hydrolase 1 [Propithecus coquereli]|uniref:ADP-ribosyl cyclase/cyclic ADP-ribose hydrolase 1 n=1 Tax=Propithecus coquereli TaxID=379532 RepID=UPI00063F507E|nr:PREDICTED: ADP-ribosyl cyclase/cyclic ADP-ribose hydrolase 1 [Propithecus coquereli]